MLAGATGALRTQFEKEKSAAARDVGQDQVGVARHGAVIGAVSPSAATKRQVVVAIDATVSGTDIGQAGVLKHYRMVVTLQRSDGRWLASNVAFAGTPQ